MTRYVLAAVVALAAAASPAAAQDRPKSDPFGDALNTAQGQCPGGVLVKGRAETAKDGTQLFGFYFWVDGQLREIEVSQTGQIYKDTKKSPEPVTEDVANLILGKNRGRAKLPDGRLAEIAAGALRGTPITSIAYVRQGNDLLVRFGSVTLNAQTGQVVGPAP